MTMGEGASRVVFIFLDGFGLAPPGPTNPIAVYNWPRLRPQLGARPVLGEASSGGSRLLVPLDARLGVDGLPQSATGQVSLFTGVNAAALLGYHLAAYPNARLQAVIEQDNLLLRATRAGLRATFANAYTAEYFAAVEAGRLRRSATTLCVLAAGLRIRTLDDLLRGQAVVWDITNSELRQRPGYEQVPLVEPAEAGRRLGRLALAHELVLFECFKSDLIGHKKDLGRALEHLGELDELFGSCAESMPAEATLVVCSDHGNLEDLSTGAHTRNPVPLMAIGPGAPHFASAQAITDVAPAIYCVLGAAPGAAGCTRVASHRDEGGSA